MPPKLQRRVHDAVEQARRRNGWPARKTLEVLGVAPRSYFRWLRERAWERESKPVKPVPPYEATAAEKRAVLEYSRRHLKLRHRELAWRMVDAGVAGLSPSTVYRILRENDLVCPWRRRRSRRRGWTSRGRRT